MINKIEPISCKKRAEIAIEANETWVSRQFCVITVLEHRFWSTWGQENALD